MNVKRPYLLLFFLFNLLNATAQNVVDSKIDTLELLIDKSNDAYEVYNYKDALKYASLVIDKAKQYDQDYYSFLGYDMLGGIYSETDDSIQGRIYSEKALEIARASKKDSLIAWGTLNLGILYSENKRTYDKAIRYFEESIAINEKNDQLGHVYLTYISLAWTYLDNNQLDSAYAILNKAKAISKKKKVDYLNNLYIELLFGRYYQAKKNYGRAIGQLELIARKADKDSLTDLALEVYKPLAASYHETNDFKNAFSSLQKYNHYKQKAYTLNKVQETEKARAQFDLKQAQNDLKIAIREKNYADEITSKSKSLTAIFIGATLILIAALVSLFLFFKTRKKFIDELKNKNKELIAAKEKAERLSKIKTNFLSTVSHELRTPLYGVIGISTLLKEDNNLKAYEEDLESLKFSADYLLALINDVLLLSKMDAEAVKLSQTPYELDNLIHSIIKSFEFGLQQNDNKLHLEIDKKIPNLLIGDPMRISQILMNLVGNAVKFNKRGNIWLKIALIEFSDDGFCKTQFTIKDDGIGIPLDKQKIIFNEFTQVENKNYSYKGTGLGLTIVKKLLNLYNSEINLKSKPGQGSTFSFSLLLEKNTSKITQKKGKSILIQDLEQTIKNGNKHVLIADDNGINQKVTQKILKKYNIKSSLANNGKQAVDMSMKNTYDLILMDINMPETNGIEAAILIRKFDKNIPIIALTAVELDEIREEIINSGIDDIIHKPYDMYEFVEIILKNLSDEKIDVSN